MKKIPPIIIIGMNRSGTKWLSNILCNHPDVIGVQDERNKGIIESNVLQGVMQCKFDLSHMEDYVAFIELWSNTTFFINTQAEKEMFYRLNPKPNNFCELFRILMEDYAERNSRKYWLQKTSPFEALKVMDYFSDGYFIVIKRDIIDTLKSKLMLLLKEDKKRESGLIRNVFFYVFEEKILNEICRRKDIAYVEYEKLVENPKDQIKKVCEYIGIKFEPKMLSVPFSKNTSYEKQTEKNAIFTKTDELIIKALLKILRLLPLSALKGTRKIKKLFKDSPTPLIPGTFAHVRDKYKLWEYYPKYFSKIKENQNV